MIQLTFSEERKLKKQCSTPGVHMRNMHGAKMNFRYSKPFVLYVICSIWFEFYIRDLIIEMLRHGQIIDRFLLSLDWEEYFSDVSQRHLRRILSNHFPLMLGCGVGSRGSRHFKFENVAAIGGFCRASKNLVGFI